MDVGILTRYFLRRYALARRDPSNVIPYLTALGEVIVVTLLGPFAALYSVFLITSLKWPLLSRGQLDQMATLSVWIPLSLVVLAIGILLLWRKFSKYRLDPTISAEFDSERDRKIIFWQRTACIAIYGFVIPALAVVVTFLIF
jgi:hypothetical protein